MKTIVLASNNSNKLVELTSAISPFGFEVKTLKDLNLTSPIEDGSTFEENSLIKSRDAFKKTGIPTFADDSGLCVDSLNGFPGLVTARFAESVGSFEKAAEILNNCLNPNNKKAQFVSCISFIYTYGGKTIEKTFTGVINGTITYPGKGDKGFAFCPYFTPNGYDQTFGEMPLELRTSINHRAIAMNKFLEFLKSNLNIK